MTIGKKSTDVKATQIPEDQGKPAFSLGVDGKMTNKVDDTKMALILAGGELFAELGFEGTSTRSIALKAGANIAAINYHFGSKENLYSEVIDNAVMASRSKSLEGNIAEADLANDRCRVEETVHRIIEELFKVRFSKNRPPWFDKMIMRALFERPSGFDDILKKSFQPDHEALKQFALRANPSLTERQAHLWVLSVFGQIMIYTFAKDAILTILKVREYDSEYIDDAVANVTRVSVAGLFSLTPERD